ncbi:hypothetical protein OG800_50575 (plasmid) [Streptomyces sp. NBC_00445]|uniref:hypothetical protein n=1 Tax=Streptomyces sp. NBC_00445 TaxID=2975745 RepID=UPI002E20BC25
MSKSDFIASAADRLNAGASIGPRVREQVIRFLKTAAADDGHIPEEPEARRCAVRIANALEEDAHARDADTTPLSQVIELRQRLQGKEGVRLAKALCAALRSMYPEASALELYEIGGGDYAVRRLVAADGRLVRDLNIWYPNEPLPALPHHLRAQWPEDGLTSVGRLAEAIETLQLAGYEFDNLPGPARRTGHGDSFIPALLLDQPSTESGS